MKDYYKILGVARQSTEDTIKQRFKELAFENHPDVSDNKNAHETFIEIYEAYHILSIPEKRANYDLLYDNFIAKTKDRIQNAESIMSDVQDEANTARENAKQKSKIKYRDFIKDLDCFFTSGLKANGKPYYYNMHKTTGISGGTGPMGSIKAKTISIPIPRSKKAASLHSAGFIVKAAFFVLMIFAFKIEFVIKLQLLEKVLLAFLILLTGGMLTYLIYRLNNTKSIYFNARKYFLVRKYRKNGYKRGFHPMMSTTPAGIIAGIFRVIF
jgi:hypothetical protein